MIIIVASAVKVQLVLTFSLIVLWLLRCEKIYIMWLDACPSLGLKMWLISGRNTIHYKLKICSSQLLSGLSGEVGMICVLIMPHGWVSR